MALKNTENIKKKVIFLLSDLGEGGGARVALELSQNLPKSIGKIFVLFKNQISHPYEGDIIFLGVPVYVRFFEKIYYFLLSLVRFKKIIKDQNPDHVVSFGAPSNLANILSGQKAILWIGGFASSSGALYKFLVRFFYSKAPQLICDSYASAKDLERNFGIKKEKIKVIYNPINVQKIHKLSLDPLESCYKDIFEKPIVITVGRLSPEKNHAGLLEAFKQVKNKITDAQLVIIGSGSLEPGLKKSVRNLSFQDSIHFLGWQSNPFKFLSKAKVFVLPSLREGMPCSILEAMACGLPVVSVDCKSGPREILAPNTSIDKTAENIEYGEYGILTPAFNGENSEDFLAQAILKILTDEKMAKELSVRFAQRASDFDISKIITEWGFLER